jgi:hypothetical protein
VDAEIAKLYGHIVAGRPGTHSAYILPAYKIFEDIEKRCGCKVSLDVGGELSDKAMPVNALTDQHSANDKQKKPAIDAADLKVIWEKAMSVVGGIGALPLKVPNHTSSTVVTSAFDILQSANLAWEIYRQAWSEDLNTSKYDFCDYLTFL